MSNKNNGNQNPQSAKVLKLGLNISVSGEPGTDFEIVLDDKNAVSKKEKQLQALDYLENKNSTIDAGSYELENKNNQEVAQPESASAILDHRDTLESTNFSESPKMSNPEKEDNSNFQDKSLISQIKSTMEHFEKFSDHIKEIPRLKNHPVASSTPLSDKFNSKSESSLVCSEYRSRRYSHLYDFNSRNHYYKSSIRPVGSDLFLKPLPGEGYYKRGIYTRYYDFEPYRHYGSDNSLNKTLDKNIFFKSSFDIDKCEGYNLPPEPPSGILKKSDSESGDKQSTSSADSIKDIKIYQSGGILIMQNFKDSFDVVEKKEISEFSAKLIENCNKLKMEVNSFQEERAAIGNSFDENKNSGKMVQFDLSSFESQKSKEGDSSSNAFKDESSSKLESSGSVSDCLKNKGEYISPQGISHGQDFLSLSTQENDSVLSNQPGTSPTYANSKKLEWDSGADVGYRTLDPTKNLSTIEKIVLKSLSNEGLNEKNIVLEKSQVQSQCTQPKVVLEKKFPDGTVEEITDELSKSNNKKDTDTSHGSKKKRKRFIEKVNERITPRETTKDECPPKFEDVKPLSNWSCTKENFTTIQPNENLLEAGEKKLDTEFGNIEWRTPPKQSNLREYIKLSESPSKSKFKKSPKLGLSKNKKPLPQKLLKAPKKASVSSISAKLSGSALSMGIPKKVYKEVEATPALNDVELSREVEEITIDHRFKIKQNIIPRREVVKEFEASDKDKGSNIKDIKIKNRPISASSGSNNTVLRKSEIKENVGEKTKKNSELYKFTDQIIQTSDYDCESVGVQAFDSQVSSDCDFKSFEKVAVVKTLSKKDKTNVNTTSKNIQAFGLNSSLPKQLEPSKDIELVDNHHTKGTQFFGGPINSLPNYHSNLVTKPGECCGRTPNILKTKKNSEAEIIRVKEKNEKNILANDAPKLVENKKDSSKHCDSENKENFINQKSVNSSKSQSDESRKNSKGNASRNSDKNDSEWKKKSPLVESSNSLPFERLNSPRMSDEVSSMVLTSEILKVHGDSIDRNIIQEKYFQSQLVELEKRKMISKSTSMEIHLQLEDDDTSKEFKTVGCQYSTQSRETTRETNYEVTEDELVKENSSGKSRRQSQEYYSLNQNLAENRFGTSKSTNQGQGLGAGDSLPSSTQTAHSWIPGMQNFCENTTGVGKARSFEYLPGHIYESSGNIREKLPSETEKNLITSSSESDTRKGSFSDGRTQDSEGRNTLILENSTICSHESDRLKVLDENLAQLNFAVLKLWEKDAQIQSITQSLLANLWKESGSGDFSALGGGDSSKTEVLETKDVLDGGKIRSSTLSEISEPKPEKEFSVGCQTDEKSGPEKFYEEKKVLEKRISEEKRSQIKWIENEIHHLNILRELLEKQNSPIQKKKKLSPLTITSDDGLKSDENYCKNSSKEIPPRSVTPVYGCSISLVENAPADKKQSSEQNECQTREKQSYQYGMAVSLSGCSKNWKPLIMLPIDLQVSLKNSNLLKECINKEEEEENHLQCSRRSSKSSKSNGLLLQQKSAMFDINTQCPSARRTSETIPSTSVQADFQHHEKSNQCSQENCFCLNLSENDSPTVSRSSRSKTSEKRGSSKLRFSTEKSYTESGSKTVNTTDPELEEIESYPASQSGKKILKKSMESDLTGSFTKTKPFQGVICKCQKNVDKSDSFGSFAKQASAQNTSIQSPGSKCQKCPNHLSSSVSKPAVICKGPCQSNIYLNCEKPSENLGICRCSKIQVQKSLHCTCHVIKIHGSKCCSPESSPCTCKKRNITKKTENQFCQTDCGPFEVKNLCESKNTVEKKRQVLEKLSCDPKVAYEKVQSKSAKLKLEGKNAFERRTPEVGLPARVKSPLLGCNCQRKAEKEKMNIDDHPRQYFLKIEETEVDDSCEQMKQKKSLEVITVTVPVKKAGKGKIYDSKRLNSKSNRKAPESHDVPPKGCNCCAECAKNCRLPKQIYEQYANPKYTKTRAEKPESPTRNSGLLKPPETCSSEDLSFYPCEELPQFVSSQEYFQDKNGFVQAESSYPEKPVGEIYVPQCCEGCSCIHRNATSSREIQSEYDCHGKSNVKKYYSGENERFYHNKYEERMSQNCRPRYDNESCADDWSSESRHSRSQKLNTENNQYHSDYYNYNKREFMTKSEILKEEEQNRKVRHPSLQECLSSNRPDFYDSAERRRQIISERAKERVKKHNTRMECLLNMVQQCKDKEQSNAESKRIFTTVQMREQTMKRYKKLPEVTGKVADQKKKEEYRTNRIMADIFAKKLQIEALKGHTNLSNSVSVLYTL